MAYEKSPMADNASAIPAKPSIEMREERVLEPYRAPVRTKKPGQPDISVSEAAESAKPAETVTLSPAASALARKEQAFRREQEAFKAKQLALEKEAAEIAELKDLKAKLSAKDYSAAEKLVPYDDYTNYLIEKGAASTPEQEALKNIAAKVEGLEKEIKDDVSKRFDAAVAERRKMVKSLVEAPDSQFKRIKKAGKEAEEAVVQHILDTWEHDQVDLSPEEAAKEVEELLKEKATKWADLLDPKEETVKVDGKDVIKELPPLKAKVNTLTNNMTPTGEIKTPKKSLYGMSDSERWAEARRRAEEKLKKV